ncbi:MAG: polysaccharide deacetylase family protein [Solirubrobacteraceae bacterium]
MDADTHTQRGTFVVSLDFELNWGVRDCLDLKTYGPNLLGVRTVVPRLLELFADYDIHATWATVGFLFFDEKEDLLSALPHLRPKYVNTNKCPYTGLATVGKNEARDPFHFAWSLLRQIQQAGDQEIASHTFSHYYCLEPGQDAATFQEDLAAAVSAGARRGITLESLVFPRNEVRSDYLPLCAQQGIKAYRGTPRSRLYSPRVARDESRSRRALRLADAYVPMTGHNTHQSTVASALPRNVPASRFLRPYDPRLSRLDPLKVKRVCGELSAAAIAGGVYHLWWHPHNFGIHQDANFDLLKRVLSHFAQLRETHGMQSLTMRDAALATQ